MQNLTESLQGMEQLGVAETRTYGGTDEKRWDLRRVKEQLPPQHPARRLLVSPAEVRKKLSQQQIDDLLQMIGSNDFIRLVFSLYLHILS